MREKSAFVWCIQSLASILISSKHYVRYTAIKLIDTFSTSYFSRGPWIYVKVKLSITWNYRRVCMICTDRSDGLWKLWEFRMKYRKPSGDRRKLQGFRIGYLEPSDVRWNLRGVYIENTKPPDSPQNFWRFRSKYAKRSGRPSDSKRFRVKITKPSNDLRNLWVFCIKHMNLSNDSWNSRGFCIKYTELLMIYRTCESFVSNV